MSYKNVEVIQYDDGSQYRGEINAEGLREGFGHLSAADGSIYLGKFYQDMYHGEGVYLYSDG